MPIQVTESRGSGRLRLIPFGDLEKKTQTLPTMEEKEMKTIIVTFAVIIALSLGAGNLHAQAPEKPWMVEGLAGAAVPTFDITDLADPGFVAGIAGGYLISKKVLAMVELDFGTHVGANAGPDVSVYHYMAKAGYLAYGSQDTKWRIFVNAGAGAMTFDADAAGGHCKYVPGNQCRRQDLLRYQRSNQPCYQSAG
jgi:hypothetical protein